jgi:WD40 repeat protein
MCRIRDDLRAAGLLVWTDENLVPGTKSWKDAIEKAIEQAYSLVVILSPAAKQSEWIERELEYANLWGLAIFPVLARGKEQDAIPLELLTHQRVDIRNPGDYGAGIDKLISAIHEAGDILERDLPKPSQVILPEAQRDRRPLRKRRSKQYRLVAGLFVLLCVAAGLTIALLIITPLVTLQDKPKSEPRAEIPELEIISPENGEMMEQISVFGRGVLVDVAWTLNDTYLLAADEAGVAMISGIDYVEEEYVSAEGIVVSIATGQAGRFVAILEDTATAEWLGTKVRVVALDDLSTYYLVEALKGYQSTAVALDRHETKLAVANKSSVSIYDLDNRQPIDSIPVSESVRALGFIDPINGLIVAYGAQAELISQDSFDILQSYKWRGTQEDHDQRGLPPYPLAIALSSDENRLAVSVSDENVYIWDVGSGELINKIHSPFGLVHGLAFVPDENVLLGGADGGLLRWNLNTQDSRTAPASGIETLSISNDGHRVALVESSNILTIRDSDLLSVIETHQGGDLLGPSQILFLSGRDHIAVLGNDTTHWDIRSLPPQLISSYDEIDIGYFADVSSDGSLLVASSATNAEKVGVWDLSEYGWAFGPTGHTDRIWAVAISSDDRWLATGDEDGLIILTDLLSHDQERVWGGQGADTATPEEGDLGSVNGLAFSPTWTTLLASVHLGGEVNFWNISTGERLGSDLAGRFSANDGYYSGQLKLAKNAK